ncbi:hypothetical protein O7621_08195 [Solwaraspora sp. WMMD937]|uniref:hypothetical protein n=1 Tax=Solwaraspora sp. WMMD937 TaxID=3016090 RepID=UPI00249B5204|nr:hypothetical protein [Solwaraspora sp. WMMD937]WFE23272.1 hypothetical protein O7621_08195 [Solwaraspora sp. WMMD937]
MGETVTGAGDPTGPTDPAESTDQADPAGPGTSTVRLATGVAAVVLAMLAGFALGRAVTAPTSIGTQYAAGAADHTHPPGTTPHVHDGTDGTDGGDQVSGLSVSAGGYTLVPVRRQLPVGEQVDLRFQIIDADQRPVTAFDVVHDKPMHLIIARRDLTGYQHLHPTMAPDGTWSVPVRLAAAGIWRLYTDFTLRDSGGTPVALTLGVDLAVAGEYLPADLPTAADTAEVDDFTVRMRGVAQRGVVTPLLFEVSRAGRSPTLEPYLGAYGHLVALRDGDLGYLHVHPEAELVDGAVKFWLTAPSSGDYRLFLDFQVAGEVHTAEFTVTVD